MKKTLLVVEGDDVLLDGKRVGAAIKVLDGDLKQPRVAALEAVRRPEANLMLLGSDKAVRELFEFSFAQAQHCRGISGSETRIVCEVSSKRTLDAVQKVVADDESGVPVVAILQRDAGLWFDALDTAATA